MHYMYVLLPEFTMIDTVLFIIFEFCLVVHRVSGVCVCVCVFVADAHKRVTAS